jgi:flagellar assembly protein FliH
MMSLSKLLRNAIVSEKIVIGDLSSRINADIQAEEILKSEFGDIDIITSLEGRKLVPIKFVADIHNNLHDQNTRLKNEIDQIQKTLLEEKRREKEIANSEGHEAGYRKGYDEGLNAGQEEARRVVANFENLIKDAIKQRDLLYNQARQKIIDLIIEISRKITFDTATANPEITSGIVSSVIEKLTDKSKIKVKISPDHLPTVEKQIDRFKGDSTTIKEITLEADPRVRNGGCIIETPGGDVDVRLETQMDIVANILNDDEA